MATTLVPAEALKPGHQLVVALPLHTSPATLRYHLASEHGVIECDRYTDPSGDLTESEVCVRFVMTVTTVFARTGEGDVIIDAKTVLHSDPGVLEATWIVNASAPVQIIDAGLLV